MEKKIILLILIVFVLVTGCSVTTLDSTDYSHNVEAILSSEKGKAYNTYFEGYKILFGLTGTIGDEIERKEIEDREAGVAIAIEGGSGIPDTVSIDINNSKDINIIFQKS